MKTNKLVFVVCLLVSTLSNALSYDLNVPPQIEKQMQNDLSFISGVQGAATTAFHKRIFGNLSGKIYLTFFTSRVTNIGMSSCGDGMAVACVNPLSDTNKMWLTENFVKFTHPQIARIMVIFHEARHTEANDYFWFHTNCPKPFLDENGRDVLSIWTGSQLAGEDACDDNAFGAYGSSTIMLKNISLNCDNCSEKVRMDADLYTTDQLNRIVKPDAKKSMIEDFKKSSK